MRQEGSTIELAFPYLRPAILLWLAALPEADWVTLEDLAEHLGGSRPTGGAPRSWGARRRPRHDAGPRPDGSRRGRGRIELGGGRRRRPQGAPARPRVPARPGPRGGDDPGGRRAVQLTALGRYILAIGPPPEPRPSFEQFLFVQPNFEMIAYRQGLNPSLIGQFSRFARWSQIGAALELKLTPETIYRGLEGGLTSGDARSPDEARLAPLPAGVAEALRTWAGRRERVTYHASATLIEFASGEDLERALTLWPETDRAAPIAISERLLLVEDEAAIPFGRFRMTGSREYRRPPETCVEVEPDGVTLTLDLARSDLLVDAELIRFADEQSREPSQGPPATRADGSGSLPSRSHAPWRAARVTPGSQRWFEQRTRRGNPPRDRPPPARGEPPGARVPRSRPNAGWSSTRRPPP
jgi:hypothetical protein